MKSIRARLLIGLLGSVLAVQLVMYLLILARIEDEIDDLFDGELERSALSSAYGTPHMLIPTPARKVEDPQCPLIKAARSTAYRARHPPDFRSAYFMAENGGCLRARWVVNTW